MSNSNQLRLQSNSSLPATATATPSLNYIDRLPTELLERVFQSIDAYDTRRFQPYRPIIARVAPRWNDMMGRITYYYAYGEKCAFLLVGMFKRHPARAALAKTLDITYSDAADGNVLQELLYRAPTLAKLQLIVISYGLRAPNSQFWVPIEKGFCTLLALEEITLVHVGESSGADVICVPYRILLDICSLKNVRRLDMRENPFDIPDLPIRLTPIPPSFSNLTSFKSCVSFQSMNDIDVLLQIIKQSQKTLKEIEIYHTKEYLQQWTRNWAHVGDTSSTYYLLDLAPAIFKWDFGRRGYQVDACSIIHARSNLLRHVIVAADASADIILILECFHAVEEMNIHSVDDTGNSTVLESSQMDALELWLRNDKPPNLSKLELHESRRRGTLVLAHPLMKLCEDSGIEVKRVS